MLAGVKPADVFRLASTAWAEHAYNDPRLRDALSRRDILEGAPPSRTDAERDERANAISWVSSYDAALNSHLFVIESTDEPALHTIESPLDAELPPMPFPECWFEMWDESLSGPAPLALVPWLGGMLPCGVLGYDVREKEQATTWDVSIVAQTVTGEYEVDSWDIRYVDGRTQWVVAPGSRDRVTALPADEKLQAAWALRLPVLLVHLVNVLGARHEPVPQPRARRRELARRWKVAAPVYLVNLRSAGESTPASGDPKVVYTCRWIVRGHYRRDARGKHVHPDKGLCVWVPSHVKGPPGAPWKGRAVHHTGGTP